MEDDKVIAIYDRIWGADILNMGNPSYSVATNTASSWSKLQGPQHELQRNFALSLRHKWKSEITDDIIASFIGPLPMPCVFKREELLKRIASYETKYKHSDFISNIVSEISRELICSEEIKDAAEKIKKSQQPEKQPR